MASCLSNDAQSRLQGQGVVACFLVADREEERLSDRSGSSREMQNGTIADCLLVCGLCGPLLGGTSSPCRFYTQECPFLRVAAVRA